MEGQIKSVTLLKSAKIHDGIVGIVLGKQSQGCEKRK